MIYHVLSTYFQTKNQKQTNKQTKTKQTNKQKRLELIQIITALLHISQYNNVTSSQSALVVTFKLLH